MTLESPIFGVDDFGTRVLEQLSMLRFLADHRRILPLVAVTNVGSDRARRPLPETPFLTNIPRATDVAHATAARDAVRRAHGSLADAMPASLDIFVVSDLARIVQVFDQLEAAANGSDGPWRNVGQHWHLWVSVPTTGDLSVLKPLAEKLGALPDPRSVSVYPVDATLLAAENEDDRLSALVQQVTASIWVLLHARQERKIHVPDVLPPETGLHFVHKIEAAVEVTRAPVERLAMAVQAIAGTLARLHARPPDDAHADSVVRAYASMPAAGRLLAWSKPPTVQPIDDLIMKPPTFGNSIRFSQQQQREWMIEQLSAAERAALAYEREADQRLAYSQQEARQEAEQVASDLRPATWATPNAARETELDETFPSWWWRGEYASAIRRGVDAVLAEAQARPHDVPASEFARHRELLAACRADVEGMKASSVNRALQLLLAIVTFALSLPAFSLWVGAATSDWRLRILAHVAVVTLFVVVVLLVGYWQPFTQFKRRFREGMVEPCRASAERIPVAIERALTAVRAAAGAPYLAEARRVAFQREMEIIRRMDAASTLRQHLDSYLTDVRDWLDDGERVLGKRIRVRPSLPANAPTAALEDADLRCQRPLGRAIAALDMTVWEALHAAERREAGGILIREVDRNVLREGGPTVLTRVVDLGARPAQERAPTHCTIPDCDSVGWCALYTVPVPV